MDVPCGEMLVGEMKERSRGQGSPDIAVPAEFDQFFICGLMSVAVQVNGAVRKGGRTLEFVFADVDCSWRVGDCGSEIVDHGCCC